VSATRPQVGDTVDYTITLTNDGPNSATAVVVRDELPPGLGYSGASMGSDAGPTGAVILADDTSDPILRWTIDRIPADASVRLTYSAMVLAPTGAAGEYLNAAEIVGGDQYDPDSDPASSFGTDDLADGIADDDEARLAVTPQRADISLVKTAAEPQLHIGDRSQITVTVVNAGPDPATSPTVRDILPDGLEYVPGSIGFDVLGSPATITPSDAADPVLTWSIDALAAGDSVLLTYEVELVAVVNAGALDGSAYINAAEITGSATWDPDSIPSAGFPVDDFGDGLADDDESRFTFVPYSADLSLAKAVSDAAPNVGDVVTFTVTAANAGPDTATGVTIRDAVPSGYTDITAISHGGTRSGATITWTGLTIAAGTTVDLTYTAAVRTVADAGSGHLDSAAYENVVEITGADQFDPDSDVTVGPGGDEDGDGDPHDDDESSAVTAPVAIGLAKTVAGVANNGDGTFTASFLMTIENVGLSPIDDLVVTDDVVSQFAGLAPSGFVASDGTLEANPGWNGIPASNVLASGQTLAAGESGTVSIRFVVVPGTDLGPHANTAVVGGVGPTGGVVEDVSTSGTDTDPNGDADPDEEIPTSIDFTEAPLIGLAKAVVAGPVNRHNGSFEVTYELVITNAGDVELRDVNVADDLTAVFPTPAVFELDGVRSDDFAVNSGFDGVDDLTVLAGTDTLPVGGSGTVRFDVIVWTNGDTGPFENTARATGTSPSGVEVIDDSHDGLIPDGNDNGDPTDDDDPTPVTFPAFGTIVGRVWVDVDADGVPDGDEPDVGGALVFLRCAGPDGSIGSVDDLLMQRTITGTAPITYRFRDVPPGSCEITVDPDSVAAEMELRIDPDGVVDGGTLVEVVSDGRTRADFGYVEPVDLRLTKTAPPAVDEGVEITWNLTITNVGETTATAPITMTDPIPDGVDPITVDGSGECTVADAAMTCTWNEDLPPGDAVEVRLITTAGAPGRVTNSATVAAAPTQTELNLADNTDEATVDIGALPRTGADLGMFALAGLQFLVIGFGLLVAGRRRESKSSGS
jgi:uncharacterized repeat protein (TIGR01451 family)/LPXTG-motif cell wall-anchored protein